MPRSFVCCGCIIWNPDRLVQKEIFSFALTPPPPTGRPLRDGRGSRVRRLLHRPVGKTVGNASFQVQSQHCEGREVRNSQFQRELVGHDRRSREEGKVFLERMLFKRGDTHTSYELTFAQPIWQRNFPTDIVKIDSHYISQNPGLIYS